MSVEIQVASLCGDWCTVTAGRSWTVRHLKVSLEHLVSAPVLGQQLLCDTVKLQDHQLLDDVLPASEVVQLVLIRRAPEQIACLESLRDVDGYGAQALEESIRLGLDSDLAIEAVHIGLLRINTLLSLSSDGWYMSESAQRLLQKLMAHHEVMLLAVRENGLNLVHVEGDLGDDRDITLAAVRQNGMALKWASSEHRCDREVVRAAVKQNRKALDHACPSLQNDTELRYCVY